MMFSPLPRFYPITDTGLSGLSHVRQVELMVAGGATLIQLRDKTAAARDLYDSAQAAIKFAHAHGVKVVINDRLDIAIAAGADGVHLGQCDIPPEAARSLLGQDKIVGFSTHNIEQAVRVDPAQVDYVGVGPIFGTSTKSDPDPVVGLDSLFRISQRVVVPIVAIGGITLETARSTIAAGANSIAVISDIFSAGDITGRVRAFVDQVGR